MTAAMRGVFERMSNCAAYILALDGSAQPSWDKSAGGGGLPGSVREKSSNEYDKSYGKSPNLAWAGGGTVLIVFIWLAFKALRVTSRNSSSGPGHHPDYKPSAPTDYTEVMMDALRKSENPSSTETDSAIRNALDDVRLGTEDVLRTNDSSSRSETSFGTSLDLDGLKDGENTGGGAPSIGDDSQFRFDR